MTIQRCLGCGSANIDESEIQMEWKCNDCDFIWGYDKNRMFYYFLKWNLKTGVPGLMMRVPKGCLWTGHTAEVEREEA